MELMAGWVKIMHALLVLSSASPQPSEAGDPQGDQAAMGSYYFSGQAFWG